MALRQLSTVKVFIQQLSIWDLFIRASVHLNHCLDTKQTMLFVSVGLLDLVLSNPMLHAMY